MSIDFRPLTPIRMADLFDGRLEDVGVHEHNSEGTTPDERCLTDGVNFLWAFSNAEGLVSTFTRWAPNGSPEHILRAIAGTFDVDIVSEHEPQYWGCETWGEYLAWVREMEKGGPTSSGNGSADHRCDHCGRLGANHPYNSPGRPDGIWLHSRCVEPWFESEASR